MNEANFETFYALDLDRTLIDTERAIRVLSAAADSFDTSLGEAIRQQNQLYLERGESLPIFEFIINTAGRDVADQVREQFIEQAQVQGLLLLGAQAMIAFTQSQSSSATGIVTYGSKEGQEMKITAAGLNNVPHLVTHHQDKGTMFSSWQESDGYHIPDELGGGIARELVFVDDKSVSFKNFPAHDARGYLVTAAAVHEVIELPPHVTVIRTLQDVIVAEQAIDKTTTTMQ